MSRITDLTAIAYIARNHCANPSCKKCSARSVWLRRKSWRTAKGNEHKNNGMK